MKTNLSLQSQAVVSLEIVFGCHDHFPAITLKFLLRETFNWLYRLPYGGIIFQREV